MDTHYAAVILLAILFVPIPRGSYDDGGTREWVALTYKIVDWNRFYPYSDDTMVIYEKTRFYFGADRFKSIDELWEHEITQSEHDYYVEIAPQELSAPERNGFTVIEWGGTEVK